MHKNLNLFLSSRPAKYFLTTGGWEPPVWILYVFGEKKLCLFTSFYWCLLKNEFLPGSASTTSPRRPGGFRSLGRNRAWRRWAKKFWIQKGLLRLKLIKRKLSLFVLKLFISKHIQICRSTKLIKLYFIIIN